MDKYRCNHCGKPIEDEMGYDMEACPKDVWELYGGDVQDIALAWKDEWGYICPECEYPAGPYDDEPLAKRAYLEARLIYVGSFGLENPPSICPECGFQFSNGWSRLKQHWEAKHGQVAQFSEGLSDRITSYSYFEN